MKNSIRNVFKVPLGGFRGGFLAELIGKKEDEHKLTRKE
jgi:hypothetical protein